MSWRRGMWGSIVRARVSYTDGHGANKSAESAAQGPIGATNVTPSFADAAVSRSVNENVTSGDVGTAVTASDSDDTTLAYSVVATSDADGATHLTAFNEDFEIGASSGQVTVKSGASIDLRDPRRLTRWWCRSATGRTRPATRTPSSMTR